MQLNSYQISIFNKILRHNKIFIFWPRCSGKTFLLFKYIENYILNNSDQDILFITNNQYDTKTIKNKIYKDINTCLFVNSRKLKKGISFINQNYLEMHSIEIENIEYILYNLKPSLIIFDEILHVSKFKNILTISNYISNKNSKCLFISSKINMDIVKILDNCNDFYINVYSYIPSSSLYSEYVQNFNIEEFSYKPSDLFDYNDIKYQRNLKLKKLNEIQNRG